MFLTVVPSAVHGLGKKKRKSFFFWAKRIPLNGSLTAVAAAVLEVTVGLILLVRWVSLTAKMGLDF